MATRRGHKVTPEVKAFAKLVRSTIEDCASAWEQGILAGKKDLCDGFRGWESDIQTDVVLSDLISLTHKVSAQKKIDKDIVKAYRAAFPAAEEK